MLIFFPLRQKTVHCPAKMDFFPRFSSLCAPAPFIAWPNIVIYYHLGISFAIVLTQNLHLLKMKPFMEIDVSTITQIKSARGTKIHAKTEENAGIVFLHMRKTWGKSRAFSFTLFYTQIWTWKVYLCNFSFVWLVRKDHCNQW